MENKQISRKDFIKGVGVSVAGVAMAGSMASLLTGCQEDGSASVGEVSAVTAPEWPYKYSKLDPEKVRERAYNAYKTMGGWGIGISEGIFGELAEVVGYPFDHIPPKAFVYGAAGYGRATLCGTIGVAATVIGMVTDSSEQKKLIGELFDWYKDFAFPEYQPEYDLPKTVAESYLCSDSVGNFMVAHNVDMGHPERKARCAGVAADVAAKTVELLNAHFGF